MTAPLSWTHRAADIGLEGLAVARQATIAEREALARALDILSCDGVAARYEIAVLSGGRFSLSGEIEADVTQACVVSLDPVAARISEPFAVELRPPQETSQPAGEQEVLTGNDIEPLEGGLIDAGRIVFGVLSSALDPYPRKAGAEFEWRDPEAEADTAARNPFAVLDKLKRSP
jgi:uncharacterized metal-binding protein YceD (DUF177 family)